MPPRDSRPGAADSLAALEATLTESTQRLRERLAAGDFEGATEAARARHAVLRRVPAPADDDATARVRAMLESALADDRMIEAAAAVQHARLQQRMQQIRRHSRAQAVYGETHAN